MKLHRLLPLVVLVVGVALDAPAQVCSPDAPLRRTLAVNVLDQQGNLVRGLTASDFRGEFRGQPVKIVSATPDTNPRRIVVLLDASASMTGNRNHWELGLRAARDMAAFAPSGSSVALMLFASKVIKKTEFSKGEQILADEMESLGDGYEAPENLRRTALIDAMVEGIRLLEPPTVGDAMYVIGDGGDNKSQTRYRAMEQMLFASGIRMFAFGIFDPIAERGMPELVWGPSMLHDTAVNTAGAWIAVEGIGFNEEKLKELGAIARRMYEQMAEFYRVDMELPVGVSKPQGWKLEVVDSKGKRRKDVEVIYPRKLVPCAAAPTP